MAGMNIDYKELEKGNVRLPLNRTLYLDKLLEGNSLNVEKNSEYKKVINDLDIFSYKYMKDDNKRRIFISERLKRAMKKAKITGCSFVYCESFK